MDDVPCKLLDCSMKEAKAFARKALREKRKESEFVLANKQKTWFFFFFHEPIYKRKEPQMRSF
jgi:hypothetical protein